MGNRIDTPTVAKALLTQGVSLGALPRMPLAESLTVALELARALERIHRQGIAHLAIAPDSVFWDRTRQALSITPAAAARGVDAKTAGPNRFDASAGGLECLAPELSGRLPVPVDERADLYALGALMHRLLTGHPVFDAVDALGWVHAHLAQMPRPLQALEPTLPPAVCELVARLLAKTPQQRYQSAWGVQADLESCLEQLARTGTIELALGRDDICPRIVEPARLYGRELPLKRMEDALQQARRGTAEAIMLRGPAGTGKSALVAALRQSEAAGAMQLASGKMDQFQRHIPYAALSQAFAGLVAQRPATARADWAALAGESLPFLQRLVPAIVALDDGPAEPLPEDISPAETQARFAQAGADFVRLHTRPETPLVLFLDDLQWADLATLELLQHLLSDADLEHLLFIGAYRDDEVDANHPLTHVLERLRELARPVTELPLGPLGEDDLVAWLAGSLRCEPAWVAPLARIILAKTLGNPFFVQRFLEYAHQQGLLSFDRARREWTWQADALRDSVVMDDVVTLLLWQLDVLDPADRRALAECAVVGATFDAADVAYLTGIDEARLTQMILRACRHGFVRADGAARFAFAHDRVQEAASLYLDAPATRQLHARLGRQLRARLGVGDRDKTLFDAVRHLTHAVDADSPAPERRELMQLALRAAQQARHSGAPAEGLRFVRTAIACADADLWNLDATTARTLYTEAQTLAFLSAETGFAQECFDTLEAHPGDPMAMADSRAVMVNQLTMLGQYGPAVELALRALAELDFVVDLDTMIPVMATELAAWDEHVARVGYDELLLALPRRDRRVEAIVLLARSALAASFFIKPLLSPLLGVRVGNLCINSQVLRGAGEVLGMVGAACIGLRGDYRGGAAAIDFAMRAALLLNDRASLADATHMMGLVAAPWVAPLEVSLAHGRNAFRMQNEIGGLDNAGYTFFETIAARFERGEALPLVEQEIAAALAFTRKTRNLHSQQAYLSYRQLVRALRGQTAAAGRFDDAGFSEYSHLAQLGKNQMARCYFHIYKTALANYLADDAAALEHAQASAKLVRFITGFLPVGTFHLHAALAWCDAIRTGRADDPAALAAQVQASALLMAQWAESAPSTFAHRAALLRAEQAVLAGTHWQAMQAYEQAITLARASGFVHEEGLACQRAARLCDATGLTQQGRGMQQAARDCFARWGATALLASSPGGAAAAEPPARTDPGLDLDSVLKSAEAIGRELAYPELVKKLVTVALENAGAQRALLLCQGPDGRQTPEAWVETTPNGLVVVGADEGVTPLTVPATLLRAVIRERTPLLIDDAASDPRSFADAVVQERGVKSVLVMPLLRQQALIGVLYLENNLAAGLFTEARARVLRVIAGQAAVALESARLFGDLERQVALRTRELELRNLDLAREVREREAAQLELQATQDELAEAAKMASLGGLVAGVAHEINTPVGLSLTAASHFKYMIDQLDARFRAGELEQTDFERFVADSGELARSMCVSLEKAAALVRSFKLVAVDQGSDDRRRFAARAYIEDVVLTHQPLLRRAHATLKLDCDVALMVESFPGAWSQVLSNLIGNSVTHGFDAGTTDPQIHVRVTDRPDAVVLTYRDNGRGMSDAVAKRVFEPFFTTNRQSGGSGLGMHIVYNIVSQQLRGRIQLKTAPGEGVLFTIRLPKQRLTAPESAAAA